MRKDYIRGEHVDEGTDIKMKFRGHDITIYRGFFMDELRRPDDIAVQVMTDENQKAPDAVGREIEQALAARYGIEHVENMFSRKAYDDRFFANSILLHGTNAKTTQVGDVLEAYQKKYPPSPEREAQPPHISDLPLANEALQACWHAINRTDEKSRDHLRRDAQVALVAELRPLVYEAMKSRPTPGSGEPSGHEQQCAAITEAMQGLERSGRMPQSWVAPMLDSLAQATNMAIPQPPEELGKPR